MITLQIDNIGLVEHAEVTLDGITVIAGLNGTGKSTISKCLFAAVNCRKDLQFKISSDKRIEIRTHLVQWFNSDACSFETDSIFFPHMISTQLTNRIFKNYMESISNNSKENIYTIKELISEICEERTIEIHDYQNICSTVTEILERPSNEYTQHFIEQYFQDVFREQINNISNTQSAVLQFKQYDENDNNEFQITLQDNSIIDYTGNIKEQRTNSIYIDTKSVLDMCEIYQCDDMEDFDQYSTFNTELFQCMYDEKSLSFAETKESKRNVVIIEQIVQNVTHGTLKKNSNGEMEFLYKNSNKKIELPNLSSGLKIFAIIQKLLENYSLKERDILLIDEPEVHLHPEWQVLLADILVQMYKKLNIRMVINTHSPYFIRAIEVKMAENNCALSGRYYYMKMEGNTSICQDVTNETNVIYETLYKPLTTL